jgi:hypothetical protein
MEGLSSSQRIFHLDESAKVVPFVSSGTFAESADLDTGTT